jgi:hypothetical protein
MVTLNIKTNFSNVQRQLDAMRKDIATKALASALNKTVAIARTEMGRAITGEFNVSRAYVMERLKISRASFKEGRYAMSAALSGGGGKKRSANIIRFVENKTSFAEAKRRAKAGTLSQLFVKVKKTGGKKNLGKSAFIGNKGRTVFTRVGKERLPIKAVQVIDVAQMFNTKRINAKVVEVMKRRFPDIFANEARFYTSKFR